MKKSLLIIITGVSEFVVVLVGGYFFRNYQLTKFRGNFAQGSLQRFNGQSPSNQGGRMINRPIDGEILTLDEKGITIKLSDGSSKIVLFSDSTVISKSAKVTRGDLKINSKVIVSGTQNADGSITAIGLQLTGK